MYTCVAIIYFCDVFQYLIKTALFKYLHFIIILNKKPPPYAKNNVKNFIYKLNKPLHYNKLVLFN